ncbi:uncharacterized protein EI90DRAFT_3069411 [Cantharellus anzutake]|uniref:uncharacterized protein n=1 Tax=Cantharellus anzutake TaxID=1750568 RepID=UPI001908C2B5|nr:uncharacterized protein EI90DRAFT_3069411 [Cantharellus anzutake]KAF8326880.1 hypothetical protein EI90DRAFT_3069411 [Cantharellus anzutake]
MKPSPEPSIPVPSVAEPSKYHASILVDDKVRTLSNLLAIIHETEKRYGHIFEYRCPTDFDSTRFGFRIFLRFRDASSIERLGPKSLTGYHVHVPHRTNTAHKPEGEGLADLLGFAQSRMPEKENRGEVSAIPVDSDVLQGKSVQRTTAPDVDPSLNTNKDLLFVRIQAMDESQKTQFARARPHEDRLRVRHMAMLFSGFQGFAAEPTPTMTNAQKHWTWCARNLGVKPYPVPSRGSRVDRVTPKPGRQVQKAGERGRRSSASSASDVIRGAEPILTEPLLTLESLKSTTPLGDPLSAAELEKENALKKVALRHAMAQAPSLEPQKGKGEKKEKNEKDEKVMDEDTTETKRVQLVNTLNQTIQQGGGLAKAYYRRQKQALGRSK